MNIIEIAAKTASSVIDSTLTLAMKPVANHLRNQAMTERERYEKIIELPPCCKNPIPHGSLSCWN